MDGNIASLAQGQFASPGLQYSTYPYQVPDGHGALAAYYAATQQFGPQGWFGNVLGQVAQPIGGIGATLGNPQLQGVPGGWGGQLANFVPSSAGGQGFPQTGLQMGYATPQQLLASQGWLGNFVGQAGQPLGSSLGGGFGIPQIGAYSGGFGGPIYGSPQAAQTAQYLAQHAAQAAQQVALQAAQQAAQQVAQQAAQAGQHVALHVAQQGAQQAAQQAGQAGQYVAQHVAQQAAQQVAQQAAQVAQLAAQQAAQQIAAGCLGQQTYSPWNALGIQYAMPQLWGSQGAYGNLWGQGLQSTGIGLGGAFGYPQFGGGFGGLLGGQIPWGGFRGLNPFAGNPLGTQTQLAATPRFSFA